MGEVVIGYYASNVAVCCFGVCRHITTNNLQVAETTDIQICKYDN